MLPIDIFNINENDQENILIISSLENTNTEEGFSDRSFLGETFLEKYFDAKEEINYVNEKTDISY